jgi:hypothetical protein
VAYLNIPSVREYFNRFTTYNIYRPPPIRFGHWPSHPMGHHPPHPGDARPAHPQPPHPPVKSPGTKGPPGKGPIRR